MLKNINFYVCSGTGCVRLTSTDGEQVSRSEVRELTCSHEEADTRLFLHAAHAAQSRESTTIIKSPDTDVAVIGIYAASLDVFRHIRLLWLTGPKDRRRLVHLSRLAHALGTEICNSLPGYHAFTGCDTTSAFYGKGKKRSFEILIKDRTIQAGMAGQGVAPECSLDTQKSCELFVCRLYRQQNCASINEARFKIFCAKAPACKNLPQQPMPCHCTSNGPTTKTTFGNMLSKPFLPSEVAMDTVGLCMDRKK